MIMGTKRKLAIIGASDFQNPLILAAKNRGLETHVFAWAAGDIGETTADFFYPISITDIDAIVGECRRLQIDGIASIGSDLANITVAAVAEKLGLTANTPECVAASTDKGLMRQTFAAHGDPSPRFSAVKRGEMQQVDGFTFPVIVKPSDRSGSRGITKLTNADGLQEALERAQDESFHDEALVEEYLEGDEYSVEYISWKGIHEFLAITEKFTSGNPHYIETGHLEPARIDNATAIEIKQVVEHALDSLGVEYGASHSEVKVGPDGKVGIIEIGSRMGGDCIGSHLVRLSTGYDFVDAVIDIALGQKPPENKTPRRNAAAIRFVFSKEDIDTLEWLRNDNSIAIDLISSIADSNEAIVDSGSRHGFYVFSSPDLSAIEPYLPPKR